jgi:hypothetical protein
MVGDGVKTNKWGLVHFRSHCPLDYFLFFLISQNIYKKRRGAQPVVHREYTRESLRGRREAGTEI